MTSREKEDGSLLWVTVFKESNWHDLVSPNFEQVCIEWFERDEVVGRSLLKGNAIEEDAPTDDVWGHEGVRRALELDWIERVLELTGVDDTTGDVELVGDIWHIDKEVDVLGRKYDLKTYGSEEATSVMDTTNGLECFKYRNASSWKSTRRLL